MNKFSITINDTYEYHPKFVIASHADKNGRLVLYGIADLKANNINYFIDCKYKDVLISEMYPNIEEAVKAFNQLYEEVVCCY